MWHPPERIKHGLPEARWPSREEAERSLLFTPIRIGPLSAAQRTWVPAMVPWRASDDGFVTDQVVDWYRRFAEGRPGVLVVEATGIRDIPSGPLLRIGDDRFIPGLRKLVNAVREASEGETLLFIQIIDFLAVKRRPEKSKYMQRFLVIDDEHRQALAEVLEDETWLKASETEVREVLEHASDEVVEAVLRPRELEALRFGYRERVTD